VQVGGQQAIVRVTGSAHPGPLLGLLGFRTLMLGDIKLKVSKVCDKIF
jgi:hypothetical protein